MIGRAVVDESKRASRRAKRHGLDSAIGAGGDIAEGPGRVEQAALARIAVREANAAVRRDCRARPLP